MIRYTLTLREDHREKLNALLFPGDGRECAAFLVCGRSAVNQDPWSGDPEERFLSRDVIPIADHEFIERTPTRVTFSNAAYLRVLKKSEAKDFAVALVHSHPAGVNEFSTIDDHGEKSLFQLAYNRNGSLRPNLSVVFCQDGKVIARAWNSSLISSPVDLIRIAGKRIQLSYDGRGQGASPEEFARQALAFGDALNQDLKTLRVAVVGCGGTGSATAMLLARLGVGRILLIDFDHMEKTNLNRLHGSTLKDAEIKRPKVEVVADSIRLMGLGSEVVPLFLPIEDSACHDALKSVDLAFGCMDDHLGRMVLNRLAYCYSIPVIDMGLAMDVNDEVSPPQIRTLEGRVTTLTHGNACLLCRRVIDPAIAREEQLKKSDPVRYERETKEEYVRGEGNPSPAVVTFTTDVACMAVNELIDRLQGFRGEDGGASERRRFYQRSEDRRTGAVSRSECPVCQDSRLHSRGDMKPFLDLVL